MLCYVVLYCVKFNRYCIIQVQYPFLSVQFSYFLRSSIFPLMFVFVCCSKRSSLFSLSLSHSLILSLFIYDSFVFIESIFNSNSISFRFVSFYSIHLNQFGLIVFVLYFVLLCLFSQLIILFIHSLDCPNLFIQFNYSSRVESSRV